MVSIAGLILLFAVYATAGWLLVSSGAESLAVAREQYDAMFPEFLRQPGLRPLLSIIASAAALTLALVGLPHTTGVRRLAAFGIIALAPLFLLLNLMWLM